MSSHIGTDIDHCFGSSQGLGMFASCTACNVQDKCNDEFYKRGRSSKRRADNALKNEEPVRKTINPPASHDNMMYSSSNTFEELVIKSGDDEWHYEPPKYIYISPQKTTKRLYEILDQLITHQDYLMIRDMYCTIQFELNKRFGTVADEIQSPRFRPRRTVPFKLINRPFTKADSFLSNDTQMIAMHWHHCRGHRDTNDKLAEHIYNNDEFDFKAASEFVVKRGTASLKAELIGLQKIDQWLCGSFYDEGIYDEWARIKSYTKKAKNRLKGVSRHEPQIKNSIEVWSDMLSAMLIELSCIDTPEADEYVMVSPNQVAKIYTAITGKLMSRQSARSKINSIEKYLPMWRKKGVNLY